VNSGSNSSAVSVYRERGREIRGLMDLTGGVHLSVERERGDAEGGAGPDRVQLGLGPRVGPVGQFSFFLFWFFSFCFLFCFISFSKLVQIDSNQYVNFSKNQLNILRQ
jgi:hypothetical protein